MTNSPSTSAPDLMAVAELTPDALKAITECAEHLLAITRQVRVEQMAQMLCHEADHLTLVRGCEVRQDGNWATFLAGVYAYDADEHLVMIPRARLLSFCLQHAREEVRAVAASVRSEPVEVRSDGDYLCFSFADDYKSGDIVRALQTAFELPEVGTFYRQRPGLDQPMVRAVVTSYAAGGDVPLFSYSCFADPILAAATDEALLGMIEHSWGDGAFTDMVHYYWLDRCLDEAVTFAKRHNHLIDEGRAECFSVEIDATAAHLWLQRHRPTLATRHR